ncbi:MAG TPA: MBOAT family O-acyltransferase [Bacteroidia bacterium]|nr:MBOAT family O-acyltransferase [Bacteroidia bacterium]
MLLASIFFYSWGAPRFVFVILVTTTLDFYLVKIMSDSSSKKRRKLFLVISLCLNLGLLLYFKYCNFFIENLNSLLVLLRSEEIKWIGIALPIGISFYTFETITYVVDVYRKEHRPLSNFLEYQLYILFFPKLIAGPIIRFSQISDQIRGRFANYDLDMILNGFFRFVLGLSKKVFLANTIGLTANAVFSSDSHTLGTADCWIGAIAYSFQIYFDFSGYSDMAIGLAKMFGFRFPENFENPYTANSITEFWKRWHISLGSWMKNYLYIPLGGNRVSSNKRLYFNLGLVFLLCGFWHGAAWTFIVWGLFYGAWLILEKIFLLKWLSKIGRSSLLYTSVIILTAGVIFRSDNLSQAFSIIGKMFRWSLSGLHHITVGNKAMFVFFLCTIFSFFVLLPYGERIQKYLFYKEDKSVQAQFLVISLSLCAFILLLGIITSSNFNPFIYFRF